MNEEVETDTAIYKVCILILSNKFIQIHEDSWGIYWGSPLVDTTIQQYTITQA